MTGSAAKYEIQFRARTRWRIIGQWHRWPREALRDCRDHFPSFAWRLVWNGLVIDPPGVPRTSLPMLRINVGDADD